MNTFVAIGILAIKHDKLEILKKVLDKFGSIISLAEGKGGLVVILSLPSASIHNAFYYFGIYALWKMKGGAINLLINYKIEREHYGKLHYFRIWESGAIMAPEAVNGADKMFDHLKDDFAKNDFIKKFIAVDGEAFVDIACQFNMLFCLQAAKEKEGGGNEAWAYPNFGRFYGYRVSKFIDRIKNREDFQKFIEDATGEKAQTFGEKFNSRIQTYRSKGLGAGYFWQSIENWEDQSR